MTNETKFVEKPQGDDPWDIAIIGSGPSAFTAAIYTTRGAASTLILGGENWGGQLMLTTTVDNFPGFPQGVQGPDLMNLMKAQAVRFGAEFIDKNVTNVNFSTTPYKITTSADKTYFAKCVIIATGALTRWLGVPGEKELLGRGVSSCAPCDAPFYKDKKVAVVGGGDAAMEEALVLTKYATDVTIIHRHEEFRASAAMQQKVLSNPKIKVVWNKEVKEILGATKVEKLKLLDTKTNTESEMVIDGVFVAIGHKPDSDIVAGPIEVDEKGFIKVSDHTKTNISGVYVAGDVHDAQYKQAITAAGFGCMAGMDALRFLDKDTPSW